MRPVDTIRCEACAGRGYVYLGINVNGLEETEPCPLCEGTGRDLADITARNHVEGREREDRP